MADLITIVYNENEENAVIANFLNAQIKRTTKYEVVICAQAKYESSLLKMNYWAKSLTKR